MDYTENMLFQFARKLNNYRKFESDQDMYDLIDEFLTEYDPYNQPERSKREDANIIISHPMPEEVKKYL